MVGENKALLFNFSKKTFEKESYIHDQKVLNFNGQILQAAAILHENL